MWAVVPVKTLSAAKQRVAAVLAPHERRMLYCAMLSDVLATLSAMDDLAGITLVSSDPEAAAFAARFGARWIAEARDVGQSAAVTTAAAVLSAEGVARLIAVPGDVPLVTGDEVRAVGAALPAAPGAVIVPARDGLGSNCVACSPVDTVPFCFGGASFERHQRLWRDRGIEPRILRLTGLALDVDTPEDLAELLARDADTETHSYLRASGIAARLADGHDARAVQGR